MYETGTTAEKQTERVDVDMLVALQVRERGKRRFWQRGKRWDRGEVSSRFVETCGVRFLLIEAEKNRDGGIDWKEVRRIACGESGRMLLPRHVIPPQGSGIRPFSGSALQQALMLAAAAHLLRLAGVPPRYMKAAVYDPAARLPALAGTLLPFAADVRVVTDRPQAYASQERFAMDAYGAALPVGTDIQALEGASLVLAPDGMQGRRPRVRGVILSGREENQPGVVGGYVPQVPPDCLEKLPEGCDAWQFLAGLYELSGARALGEKPPLLLRMGARNLAPRDIAWKLAGLDIGISV